MSKKQVNAVCLGTILVCGLVSPPRAAAKEATCNNVCLTQSSCPSSSNACRDQAIWCVSFGCQTWQDYGNACGVGQVLILCI